MAGTSAIEWTEATWNPVVGCSIVSPGCTNCYAMKMAYRLQAMAPRPDGTGNPHLLHYVKTVTRDPTNRGYDWSAPVWTGKLALAPESILLQPLKRKKPTTYFVNSMGDLFHEDCPDEWIDRVFAVMALCPQHTFQVLTKRAKRMREYCSNDFTRGRIAAARLLNLMRGSGQGDIDQVMPWPLPNVWKGTSTERQQEADERIPELLATPAAVRFISAEPLLGPITLISKLGGTQWIGGQRGCDGMHRGDGSPGCPRELHHHHDERCERGLDWVIVGGESGPGARPMHPDWARGLRDQCAAASVPFFFKQWGSWREPIGEGDYDTAKGRAGKPPAFIVSRDGTVHCFGRNGDDDRPVMIEVGKKRAGRMLDGELHDAMPEIAR